MNNKEPVPFGTVCRDELWRKEIQRILKYNSGSDYHWNGKMEVEIETFDLVGAECDLVAMLRQIVDGDLPTMATNENV